MQYETILRLQNFSLQYGIQILSDAVSTKMKILCFSLKRYLKNSMIQFFRQNMWDTKKTFRWRIICLNIVYKLSLWHFSAGCIFYVLILKNTIENKNFYSIFYHNMWDTKKALKFKIVWLNKVYKFYSFSKYLEKSKLF